MPQLSPRDTNGRPLCIGDTVYLPCIITGCVKHKAIDGQEPRELMTLQVVGPKGYTGMTPRVDAIEPGLVTLVKPKLEMEV